MSKLNWDRHRQTGAAYGKSGEDRYLERFADRMLREKPAPKAKRYSAHAKRRRPAEQIAEGLSEALAIATHAVPDGVRYRNVGAVIYSDGEYRAVNPAGETIGTFATRAEAWRCAAALGMEEI